MGVSFFTDPLPAPKKNKNSKQQTNNTTNNTHITTWWLSFWSPLRPQPTGVLLDKLTPPLCRGLKTLQAAAATSPAGIAQRQRDMQIKAGSDLAPEIFRWSELAAFGVFFFFRLTSIFYEHM